MERADLRVERSRQAIVGAFLELMKRREYDSITVKDLAEAAYINRKTFYAHFDTKQMLFEAMMREMFQDIFSPFMYAKEEPGMDVDANVLLKDIRCFLRTVESYRDELEIMITNQTSEMAFAIAEDVIMDRAKDIYLTTENAKGKVPVRLYVMSIKVFFMMLIDWWLDGPEISLDEAAVIVSRLMRKSTCSIFRYQRTFGLEESIAPVWENS